VGVASAKSTTIVNKQNVNEYAWSPDSESLAIGKPGELVFHEIETGREQSIAFKEINTGLDHHAARCHTWNPAGDSVACRIEPTGGRKAGGHVLAGDEEVFIVPREGKPRSISIGKTQPRRRARQAIRRKPFSDGTPMGSSVV
jgi:hypothetical protein